MPCDHVYSKFRSPGFPHFLCQLPPGAQQLSAPVFGTVPQLGQLFPDVHVKILVLESHKNTIIFEFDPKPIPVGVVIAVVFAIPLTIFCTIEWFQSSKTEKQENRKRGNDTMCWS